MNWIIKWCCLEGPVSVAVIEMLGLKRKNSEITFEAYNNGSSAITSTFYFV